MAVTATKENRWFYVAMAVLFASTAIVGFAPNSLAILEGTKENPPLLIHVHAAAMSMWLMLLFTQAMLVATGNLHHHMRLGTVSLVLAPNIVIIMILITYSQIQSGSAPAWLVATQVKRVTLFTLFFVWAMAVRRRDSEAHKRLLFLATFVVLDAAFNRMLWFLPDLGYAPTVRLFELVLLVPLLTYDWVTVGRLNKVYVIGVPIILAGSIAIVFFWYF